MADDEFEGPVPEKEHRVTTYLFEDEFQAVERARREWRCSRSEAIRRAVHGYFLKDDSDR